MGNQEFISQTNNNSDSVPEEDRFKYVDDLTVLEIVNLLNIGLTNFDFMEQAASDIPESGLFLDNNNLQSQNYLNAINDWTINQKMLINKKKTKGMIINFTRNHQFSTRLQIENTNIDIVKQMKILGTIITDDLTWDENTN